LTSLTTLLQARARHRSI